MWNSFDNGRTIGTKGSENGIILQDEEHTSGARLTLEQDGSTAPFSITSGVYDCFVHTTFLSSLAEAKTKLNCMKKEITELLALDISGDELYEWTNKFIHRH